MSDSARLAGRAVEYNVTEHCNLRCAGCDHASPILARRFADPESFRADLTALAVVFHAGELKLLGGEPLLHPRLLDFMRVARAIDVADRLTLVTNGVLLHRVDDAMFDLIDEMRVSVYPGVDIRSDLARLTDLARRRHVRLDVYHKPKFRYTLLNTRHRDERLVRRIYRRCDLAGRWSCHTIRDGYYYKCSPAPFLEPRLARKGVHVDNRARDGVRLHDNPRLREELERYLREPEPLEACRYCLGSSGREFRHHQLHRDELRAAAEEEHPDPGALLERRPMHVVGRAVGVFLADVLGAVHATRRPGA